MAGQPEDEAISLSLHVGDSVVTSLGKLLALLLRAADSYKKARNNSEDQAKEKRNPVAAVANAAGTALHDAAARNIDGFGAKGFVKNSMLGDDVTFIDAPDVFENDKTGDALKRFKKAINDNGIAVSFERGIPGDGMLRIGVSAKNVNLLADGLLRAGLTLTDEGIISRDELDQAITSSSDKDKIVMAPRDDEGHYLDTFSYAGFKFQKDKDHDNTWVAADALDERRKISISIDEKENSTWSITRNGVELASGTGAPITDPDKDERCAFYKKGGLAFTVDDNGQEVPVYKRDEDGNAILDETGKPVQAHLKVRCSADDPDIAFREITSDVNGSLLTTSGQPLESVALAASLKLDQLALDPSVRKEAAQVVKNLSEAADVATLPKDPGGTNKGEAQSPISKNYAKAKRAATAFDEKLKNMSARTAKEPRHHV